MPRQPGRWQARPTVSTEPLDVLAESPAKAAIGALLLTCTAVLVVLAILLSGAPR